MKKQTILLLAAYLIFYVPAATLTASVSSERVELYKRHGLISQTFVLPEGRLFFNPEIRKWEIRGDGSFADSDLLEKYGNYTLDEWADFDWTSPEAQEAAEYLSKVFNGEIPSSMISKADARDLLMNGFSREFNGIFPLRGLERECAYMCYLWMGDSNAAWSSSGFEREGDSQKRYMFGELCPKLDFSNADVENFNLNNFSSGQIIGMDPRQVSKLEGIYNSVLVMELTFDAIAKTYMGSCDLSGCTYADIYAAKAAAFRIAEKNSCIFPDTKGADPISGEDILVLYRNERENGDWALSGVRPFSGINPVFNGNEDFSGLEISGMHFAFWKGITSSQIMSANKNWSGAVLPPISFGGGEIFSGLILNNTDISRCANISIEQIASTPPQNLKDVMLSKTQFEAFRATLKSIGVESVKVNGRTYSNSEL